MASSAPAPTVAPTFRWRPLAALLLAALLLAIACVPLPAVGQQTTGKAASQHGELTPLGSAADSVTPPTTTAPANESAGSDDRPAPTAAAAGDGLIMPDDATEEELSEVVVPLSDEVLRKITDALQREQRSGQPQSTGDLILDDVLDVIRRQGSVLDGSTLESMMQQPPVTGPNPRSQPPTAQSAHPSLAPHPSLPPVIDPLLPSAGGLPAGMPQTTSEMRFFVAESLLRSARELAALPGSDAQRQRLIAAMREQATVLMIDEFAPTAADR